MNIENIRLKEEKEKQSVIPIHFENEDIIITDPCYIIKENKMPDDIKHPKYTEGMDMDEYQKAVDEYYKKVNEYDDWKKCDYGDNMEILGIKNYKTRDTLYGDWSCTVYNTDTSEAIGNFCADAGMVGVFSLKEVLEYNPNFDWHINRKWTTALIKNFTGDVWFEVKHTEGTYDEDEPIMYYKDDTHTETVQATDSNGNPRFYHRKGDKWSNDSVHVVGKGNINFCTEQTGL